MNCRTLEYIVAVKEAGSVLQAAKACNVTVGTISGQITRGSTPFFRTLQRSPIMGKRSVYVQAKTIQRGVQAGRR